MAESQTRSGALGYCYACLDDAAYGVENGEDVKFPDEESSTTEGAE
jgi:hypothetical protein